MVSSNDNAVTPQCCHALHGANATPGTVGRAIARVRSHRKLVAEARRRTRELTSAVTASARHKRVYARLRRAIVALRNGNQLRSTCATVDPATRDSNDVLASIAA